MNLNLLPEDRLCLYLAQAHLNDQARERALALLARKLQWERVIAQVYSNEVFPLVYRNLRELGFSCVPQQVHDELESRFRINALRNKLLAAQLAQVLRALHQSGIQAIPWKGLYLAETLYGDLDLRACADLDLLVPRQQVTEAFDRVVSEGFHAEIPRWFLSDRVRANSFEVALRRMDRSVAYRLDLHWGLLWEEFGEEGSIRDLWQKSGTAMFLDVPVRILSREWLLLSLAAHAYRHNWQGLKWLVDIHEICRRGNLDWGLLTATATALGWDRLVRQTLKVCHILLDTPIPEECLQEATPVRIPLYPTRPQFSNPAWNTLLAVRMTKRPSHMVRFFLRRLLVPTVADAQMFRLPESLGFLYYCLRPFRLLYLSSSLVLQAILRGIVRFSRGLAVGERLYH